MYFYLRTVVLLIAHLTAVFTVIHFIYVCVYTQSVTSVFFSVCIHSTLCSIKKRHPFYFHDVFVICYPILLIFGRKVLEGICNKHIYCPPHLIWYVPTGPCKNQQQFLQQTVQRQLWCFHIKVTVQLSIG